MQKNHPKSTATCCSRLMNISKSTYFECMKGRRRVRWGRHGQDVGAQLPWYTRRQLYALIWSFHPSSYPSHVEFIQLRHRRRPSCQNNHWQNYQSHTNKNAPISLPITIAHHPICLIFLLADFSTNGQSLHLTPWGSVRWINSQISFYSIQIQQTN